MVVGGFLFSSTYISFDDIKFMAGKSMWRGGEFAPRRKSQSSDAQKKTSCQCQSRRSQVRSTQRRGLFRTIIFSGKRSWPSCVLDQLHFKVKGYNAGKSQSVFCIGLKAPSGKRNESFSLPLLLTISIVFFWDFSDY